MKAKKKKNGVEKGVSISSHPRSELWSERGRNTQDSGWSFAKPSLKLTFSSMPGTQKWVIKVSSDALKVSLSGSAASSPRQGHGRSRQPQKAISAALPLSRLLSMGGIPTMEPQGGTGAERQILLGPQKKNATLHQTDFLGGCLWTGFRVPEPLQSCMQTLVCTYLCFSGDGSVEFLIPQGIRDRNRGRTIKPGKDNSGDGGRLRSPRRG